MTAAVVSGKKPKKPGCFQCLRGWIKRWRGQARTWVWKRWEKKASCKDAGNKGGEGWERRAGKCRRTGNPGKGCGEHWEGHANRGRAGQALTFPQHEEVRLLVRVEVSEGRQGAPGLGPKELGRDVVQCPRRDRPDSQQREAPKQRRQQHPGAQQPACRRHGSPSAPARRPTAALDGSRKAPCRRPREKERSPDARTTAARPRLTLP